MRDKGPAWSHFGYFCCSTCPSSQWTRGRQNPDLGLGHLQASGGANRSDKRPARRGAVSQRCLATVMDTNSN